jgi:hypothetical protein
MFRFADIGRQWVPVDLPQDGATVRVHLLMDLIGRDNLRERDRELLSRTGAGLLQRMQQVEKLEELLAIFDEGTRAEAGDVADLVARTHDWRGFGSGEDEIGFNRERFAAVIAYDLAFKPIRAALFEASREGVAKNSEPGAAGSPAVAQA